jgi:hypothetical protein
MLWQHANEIFHHSLTVVHWHIKIFIDVHYSMSDFGIARKWQN